MVSWGGRASGVELRNCTREIGKVPIVKPGLQSARPLQISQNFLQTKSWIFQRCVEGSWKKDLAETTRVYIVLSLPCRVGPLWLRWVADLSWVLPLRIRLRILDELKPTPCFAEMDQHLCTPKRTDGYRWHKTAFFLPQQRAKKAQKSSRKVQPQTSAAKLIYLPGAGPEDIVHSAKSCLPKKHITHRAESRCFLITDPEGTAFHQFYKCLSTAIVAQWNYKQLKHVKAISRAHIWVSNWKGRIFSFSHSLVVDNSTAKEGKSVQVHPDDLQFAHQRMQIHRPRICNLANTNCGGAVW